MAEGAAFVLTTILRVAIVLLKVLDSNADHQAAQRPDAEATQAISSKRGLLYISICEFFPPGILITQTSFVLKDG